MIVNDELSEITQSDFSMKENSFCMLKLGTNSGANAFQSQFSIRGMFLKKPGTSNRYQTNFDIARMSSSTDFKNKINTIFSVFTAYKINKTIRPLKNSDIEIIFFLSNLSVK